ncbi:MAG: adenine phosphoribosyltransferase [Candidatus Aenigmarchaeota archaeon]|nr:adenine phosphoribosyltransferase [Candidatus Aenigmarchaeota archaeon]
MDNEGLKKKIREVPDFPKKGILFYDVTTLLKDSGALQYAVKEMKKRCLEKKIDVIVGIESRGFILGGIIAHELGVGFVPIRKKGKLPAEVVKAEYDLEYGKDHIEMHKDSILEGQNVMIIDDLLATGGTAKAAVKLVESLGGKVVGLGVLIELLFLKGREKLKGYDIFSLIQYESE